MATPAKSLNSPRVSADVKVPRYMQVFSTLQQWIAQGHYPAGAKIEAESELCEMFGVSRITIRKALEMLAAEGLVKGVQGKGTFVTKGTPGPALHAEMDQRIKRARDLALNSEVRELDIRIEPGPNDICTDLQLSPAEEVLHISYIRLLRDLNIGYVESYSPASLNVDVTPADFNNSTLLTVLEDKGVRLSGIDHLVGATLADARLARLLDVNAGAPLVRVKMIMLDKVHKPVQKVIAYFRADEYEHHLFLARDGQDGPFKEN